MVAVSLYSNATEVGYLHCEMKGGAPPKFRLPPKLQATPKSSAPTRSQRAKYAPLLILHLACEGNICCIAVFDSDPKQKDGLEKLHRSLIAQNLCGVVHIPNGKEGAKALELYLVPQMIQNG